MYLFRIVVLFWRICSMLLNFIWLNKPVRKLSGLFSRTSTLSNKLADKSVCPTEAKYLLVAQTLLSAPHDTYFIMLHNLTVKPVLSLGSLVYAHKSEERVNACLQIAPLIKGAASRASGGFVERRFKPQIPRSPFIKGANATATCVHRLGSEAIGREELLDCRTKNYILTTEP